MSKTKVSDVPPGQKVRYHKTNCLVLEHRTTGTLLMTCNQIEVAFDGSNNFNSGGSRPAFLIPSDYAVEVDEENPLEQYSLNELPAEINRRIKIAGDADA